MMAKLGSFTRSENNEFTGTIHTLTFTATLVFVPVSGLAAEAAPSHRIYAGLVEVGAAWPKTTEEGKVVHSVKIDDPSFAQPLVGTLIEADGEGLHSLLWKRPGSARYREKGSSNSDSNLKAA